MILTDSEILKAIKSGDIVITPFDKKSLGSNSYDVHLSPYCAIYTDKYIDSKKEPNVIQFEMSDRGILIEPGDFILMSTIEYTETHKHVPFIEGKSSAGRMGLSIHATAGKGDVSFCGHWTLEVSTQFPVWVYPGMPIGQLIYFKIEGQCNNPYNRKQGAKYKKQGPKPSPTAMWKNFKK